MKKIFQRIFVPYEVKILKSEIDVILKETSLTKIILKKRLETLANDVDKVLYSVRIDGMKPDHLALLLLTNVLGEELSSGSHHTYRGVLSATGIEMRSLWHQAQTILLKKGYANQQEVDEDNEWLKKQIGSAG